MYCKDSPEEWLESCRTDFLGYVSTTSERNPDVFFCMIVKDLDLSTVDIKRLGRDMDWSNYAMHTTDDFISDWEFFQKHANKETLTTDLRVSMRDSLPPGMTTIISFNYTQNGQDSYFDKPFKVNPRFLYPVCNN